MSATLNLYKQYIKKLRNVPFEVESGVHRVRFKVPEALLANQAEILEKSTDYFITHYLPEFYIHLKDPQQVTTLNDVYGDIRNYFVQNTVIENPGYDTKPPSNNKFVVTKIEFKDESQFFTDGKCIKFKSLSDLRDSLIQKDRMPDFIEALHFFNQENEIAGMPGAQINNLNGTSEFNLLEIQQTSKKFGDIMEDLAKQKLSYSGPANVAGIDFNFLTMEIRSWLDLAIKLITSQIPELSNNRFSPGDSLTFLFSQKGEADPLRLFVKNGIAGLLLSTSETGSDYVKVGYFSNILYNLVLDDQVVLSSIKNYQSLFNSVDEAAAAGLNFPMTDFLSQTLPEDTLQRLEEDNLFVFNTNSPDADNVLLQEARRQGLIDFGNNDDLKRGISALTEDEKIKLYNELENNPEFAERVYQQQKRRKLETGINIADTVNQIAETGLPFAEGSAIDTLLSQLGIKALAREALICATFGLNISVGRIAGAIGDVLEEELNERPSFDPDDFPVFKIKGDIWKVILNVILNSIQQALLALISGLAELLAQLCDINNPRKDDYGATPLGDLINNNLTGIDENALGQNPLLDQLSDLVGGASIDDIIDYLNDLADILSSIDICNLMLNPEGVDTELIDRILEFNQSYDDPRFSENLNSPNAIMAFFQLLGQIADVTEFCNEVANDILILNPDVCDCLDPETVAALSQDEQDTLNELLDIIENGLNEPPPQFSFDCPDAENYIEDPVLKRLIPETFNTLLELVQMQFIYSADSVKQAMLDRVLRAADSNPSFGSASDEQSWKDDDGDKNNPDEYPELPKPNKAAINALKPILQGIYDVVEQFTDEQNQSGALWEAFQTCIIDQPNLLRPEIRDIGTVADILLNILNSGDFQSAMDGLIDQLDDITENAQSGTPLVSTYEFKQEFYRRFVDYINIKKSGNPDISEVTIPNRFEARTIAQLRNTRIKFNFLNSRTSEEDSISLLYRHVTPQTPRADQIQIDLDALFDAGTDVQEDPELLLRDEFVNTDDTLLNIQQFVDSIKGLPLGSGEWSGVRSDFYNNINDEFIRRTLFPYFYGILTDQIFDYYRDNGVFDAGTLLSLNFFQDNTNCPPAEISDFLDVNGILKQMQKEYLEAACNNEGTPRDRMADTLMYGMFLLLVQVHIAEFVIKNIFVFAAIRMDDLFDSEFVRSYIRNQIDFYVSRFFDIVGQFIDVAPNVQDPEVAVVRIKKSLVDLFNKKINRPLVVELGGIKDEEGNIIFEPGTTFVVEKDSSDPDTVKDFNDIIIYLTTVRIQYSTGIIAGEERTPGPLVNAGKNSLPNVVNPRPLEEVFLRSMPSYYGELQGPAGIANALINQTDGSITNNFLELADLGKPKFVIVKSRVFITGDTYRMRYNFLVYVSDFYDITTGYLNAAFRTEVDNALFSLFFIEKEVSEDELSLYRASTETISGYDSDSLIEQNLTAADIEFITNNDLYKEYFNNVFNREIINIVPILQNFYLGKRYLSGIEEAMVTTKVQVITSLQSIVTSRDPYDSEPNLSRPAARNTGMSMTGPNPDTLARDFILKMLIQTPIEILKSLMEMIDPHVLLTGMIKKGTGQAFNMMLDAASNVDLPSPADFPGVEPPPPPAIFDDSASAENMILGLFCFLNHYIQNPPSGLPVPPDPPFPEPPPPPPNFFPEISADGIDLTGKGMGMLMIPPTPFGLIYFLLSLIKFDNTSQPNININVTGDGVQNANSVGQSGVPCDDAATPQLTQEDSEEDCQ